MYNTQTIIETFLPEIGWRNDSNYLEDMITSLSGLFYDEEHPMLTMENLKNISPDYDDWDFVVLSDELGAGVYLNVRNETYITLKDTTGFTDDGSTDLDSQDVTMFAKIHLFTEWLKRRTESGIINAIDDWMNSSQQVVSLIECREVYTFREAVAMDVNDIYFRTKGRGVSTVIDSVSVWYEDNQSFNLTLEDMYGTSLVVPVVYTGGKQSFNVDWTLEENTEYYIRSSATGNAFTYDNAVVRTNYDAFGYVNDIKTDFNYGINLSVSLNCDLTSFIVANKDRFRDIIIQKVAIRLLTEMIYNASTRVNRNQSNITITELRFELDGNDGKHGLVEDYKNTLKRLKLETNGLNKSCLPCQKRGVKYESVK